MSGLYPLLTLTADDDDDDDDGGGGDDDDDDDDDDDGDDYRHLHGPSVGPLLLLPDSDDSGQQPAPVAVHTDRRGRAGQNLHRGPGPARHSRSGSQSGN